MADAEPAPPRLARRRTVLAQMVATVWLFAKVGVVIAMSTWIMAVVGSTHRIATQGFFQRVGTEMNEAFRHVVIENNGDAVAAATQLGLPGWFPDITSYPGYYEFGLAPGSSGMDWLEGIVEATIEKAGGPWGAIDGSAFAVSCFGLIWFALVGPVTAILFPHLRARSILLIGVGIVAISLTEFASMTWLSNFDRWTEYGEIATISARQIGAAPIVLAVAAALIPLTLGFCFARPLARASVRAFLRPEARVPFDALWLADGKPIPATRSYVAPERRRPQG